MLEEVREQTEGVLYLRRSVERKLTSPLLLVGEEGVGRRFSIFQAVKEIFCTGTQRTGCTCLDCIQIDQGNHPDFTVLAPIDDRDIGIDAIREVIANAGSYPTMAPYRVFMIDGADRLTDAAANALLKTLEEPPSRARFFLLAEEAQHVIPTIRSRCGLIRYKRLSDAFVMSVVQKFEHDPAKALVYTRMGEGSLGRSVRFCGAGRLALRDKVVVLLQTGLERDYPRLFSMVDAIDKDFVLALRFLGHLLHDILMLRLDPPSTINSDILETLWKICAASDDVVWQKLRQGLRGIQNLHWTTSINLSFHVKSLFLDVFGV